jgi:hypothetical protein
MMIRFILAESIKAIKFYESAIINNDFLEKSAVL